MWKAEATPVTNFLCVQRVVTWSLQVSCLHLNFLMALYYLWEEFKCLVVWYVAVCPSISSSVELPTSTVQSRMCKPFTIPLTWHAVWSLRVFTQTGNDPCILCCMWTTPVQLRDPAQALPPREAFTKVSKHVVAPSAVLFPLSVEAHFVQYHLLVCLISHQTMSLFYTMSYITLYSCVQ